MAALVSHQGHLHESGPLRAETADVELQLGEAVFPVHKAHLEQQSYLFQGLFETHADLQPAAPGLLPRIALGSGSTEGGLAIATEARQALQEKHLARFLYQAYHPETQLGGLSLEQLVDLLVAADFFSDDTLRAKCDVALAEAAAGQLKGLHDPLPIYHETPTKQRRSSVELEDSAAAVLQQHGSPVKPAQDEWGAEVHVLQANNLKAKDREDLIQFLRLASRYGLPRVLSQCLPHLCKLIVAASNHHNLRHTVQEALALLDVTARTVVLFEIAQLAAEAAGDEGLQAWRLDAGRMLQKLQDTEREEAALSRHASLA